MRVIKFRAWNKDTNKIIFVNQINMTENNGAFCLNGSLSFDNFELMQFTGLKDKNGKEIYESDILKTKFIGFYEVKFGLYDNIESYDDAVCGNGFYLNDKENFFKHFYDSEDCEIIGNIFENPELLK